MYRIFNNGVRSFCVFRREFQPPALFRPISCHETKRGNENGKIHRNN